MSSMNVPQGKEFRSSVKEVIKEVVVEKEVVRRASATTAVVPTAMPAQASEELAEVQRVRQFFPRPGCGQT